MKKVIFAIFCLFILATACKKSKEPDPGGGTTPVPYMSITANSTWQYEQITNPAGPTPVSLNYTLTSTTRDTSIAGKQYHVFTNSNGNTSEYYNISGNDYYQYRNLSAALGNSKVEALYLKDNVALNGTWSQPVTVSVSGIPIALNVTYTIIEKGGSKTVNGIAYTDVITIKTDIVPTAASGIPASALTTDIKSYYARKVGMIQSDNKVSINYLGFIQNTDTQIKLKSADIK